MVSSRCYLILEELSKTKKPLSQNSRCHCRDSSGAYDEYKSSVTISVIS
jgi:hypothetical protein